MSSFGPPYPFRPHEVEYDPLQDLQQSLGGPDENNAHSRVARYHEHKFVQLNDKLEKLGKRTDISPQTAAPSSPLPTPPPPLVVNHRRAAFAELREALLRIMGGKTGWGRNEVLMAFDRAALEVL